MDESKITELRTRSQQLKAATDELGARIVDAATKEYFLRPIRHLLTDVETLLLPRAEAATNDSMWLQAATFQLSNAESQLSNARKMVEAYGTALQIFPQPSGPPRA